MTSIVIDHWLRTAERVRFKTRRVSGGRIVVILGRLPRGAYQIAIDTGAPGWPGLAKCLPDDRTFANRSNAIAGGLVEIRDYWKRIDVPAMVADVEELIEAWEHE